MGDTADGTWGSRELGGYIRREEARKMAIAGSDLVCSGCGVRIEPHTKFLCVYKTKSGGFALEVGCHHYMPPLGFQRIFGGSACFHAWLEEFEDGLRICKHDESEGANGTSVAP